MNNLNNLADLQSVPITPQVAASILGVSTQTVRVYEQLGKIKAAAITPGGQRRYLLSEIERFKAAAAEPTPPEPEFDKETLDSFTGPDTPGVNTNPVTPKLADLFKTDTVKL